MTLTTESYNRAEELKAFDDAKIGVKGLVDAGVEKVPKIFIRDEVSLKSESGGTTHLQIPVINIEGEHEEVVKEIREASEKWGFFQVVNHGVSLAVMDEMIRGAVRFNEQDDEIKKRYYTRDMNRKVRFNSNFDLYQSKVAGWRDSLGVDVMRFDPLDPYELPEVCRDITIEYAKYMVTVGDTILELISEGLGLKPKHLQEMNCTESCLVISHYYPPCPEPELTLGTTSHTDAVFITIVLQDDIGGLQVLHQGHWVDVTPIPGALVVNIGDLLQITSNDMLRSVEHRVLANRVGPRISVASFLTTRFDLDLGRHGPIKELITDGNGPIYREFSNKEYIDHFYSEGLDGRRGLSSFKL